MDNQKLNFNRFKKKSLTLLYKLLDTVINLQSIKNNKINKSIIQSNLRLYCQEQTIIYDSTLLEVNCLIKLNENQVLCLTDTGTMRLFDIGQSKFIKIYNLYENSKSICRLNSKQIFVCGNSSIRIFDLLTEKYTQHIESRARLDISCLLKFNSNLILSCDNNGHVKLWNLKLGTYTWYHARAKCLIKFSNDEFISCIGVKIKLWNIYNEKCLKTLITHSESVFMLLKLNSKIIVSRGDDRLN